MATMDFAEIQVDQKYHRRIIGKGGASGMSCKKYLGPHVTIISTSTFIVWDGGGGIFVCVILWCSIICGTIYSLS